MDGVIYRGSQLIGGAQEFVARLRKSSTKFLFLTNNSQQTPLELQLKLKSRGITGVTENDFITSAMATAMFLKEQKPNATVYVIGGEGLMRELEAVGFSFSENNPDYVVVGKTPKFSFKMMKTAVQLIGNGAKFIGTNPDVIDPTEDGFEPACGALLASIEKACGVKPYIVGKPNSLMMTLATRKLGVHADDALMIGDRMDTDIIGGLEAGMKTILVLSGVSSRETVEKFPYRPDYIFDTVGDIDLQKLNESIPYGLSADTR